MSPLSALRHTLGQGPVVRALGSAALGAALPFSSGQPLARPELPGPWCTADLEARSSSLVRDYIEEVGGDPSAYPSRVPGHLFPQWGFPLLMRTLRGLAYPYPRAVNAGCRIVQRAAIPASEPIVVRARIESIDDDGRRAVIVQRLETGTLTAPDALTAEVRVRIPLARRSASRVEGKAKPALVVPPDAIEVGALELDARAGLRFAVLTGDFNPIHWVPAYARAAGFRSTILHGFGTLARTIEVLLRGPLGGDPARLRSIDVRFTKPLVLPARVLVYTDAESGRGGERHLWVAAATDRAPYLEGRFEAFDQASTESSTS